MNSLRREQGSSTGHFLSPTIYRDNRSRRPFPALRVHASAANIAHPLPLSRSWIRRAPAGAAPPNSSRKPTEIQKTILQQELQHRTIVAWGSPCLFAGLDLENRAGGFVGQNVDVSIRRLTDIAQALAQFRQHSLLTGGLALRVEGCSQQGSCHRRHQHVSLPRRELIAIVKDQIAGIDRGRPEQYRILKTGNAIGTSGRGLSVIVHAVGNQNPAIVFSGLDTVDLITSARSELRRPEFPCHGMERQTERVAMSKRVEFRPVSGSSDERVIGGNGSVLSEAENLSDVVAGLL